MDKSLLSDLETAKTKVRACLVPLVESLIDEVKSPQGLTAYGYEVSRNLIGELEK